MGFTLPQVLWQWLTNPNVTYALLILGMWALIAAWFTPGTGVAEGLAVACLALAAVGLFRLPTNLAALLLILVALVLYVLEGQINSNGILALVATLLLTIGSMFLFHTREEIVRVSRWLILGVSVSSLALFWWLTTAGLVAQLRPVQSSARVQPGDEGEARTDLAPRGVVYVADEEWSAEAVSGTIPAGTRVRVVAVDGLHLTVEPIEE